MMFSAFSTGNVAGKHGRNNREIFRHIVRDGKCRQRAAGHQQLLADLDNLDQLRGIRIEVDHVAGFFRGLRAGVHGDANVGLSQCRRVVGAVAGHRHQLAFGLFAANQVHLVFRRGLRQKIVHTRFARDRGSGQRIVAGDHHGPDAHRAQLIEALAHAAFHDVLQSESRPARGVFSATTSGVPPERAIVSTLACTSVGIDAAVVRQILREWHRPRLCGSRGHPD